MKQHARDSRPIVRMFDASFAYGSSDENGGPEADGVCGSSEDKSIGARGISLCVEAGECLVLCGELRSGKSTVLRMIEGLPARSFPERLPVGMRPADATCGLGALVRAPRASA